MADGERPTGAGKRVGVISLGCPKNLVDTETMLGRFVESGYELTPNPEEADLLVVNTCGFVADAEAESREAIAEMAELKARHPGKKLVVTGCLSQRYGKKLQEEMPAIDVLTGSEGYERLIPIVEAVTETSEPVCSVVPLGTALFRDEPEGRVLTTQPHTAYVKIAEGCGNPCAFCIIPKLRGPFRSRSLESIEAEVRNLVAAGVREVNLVSQDTTLYGRDLAPRTDLAALLERLSNIKGITWIRPLYLYPTLINDRLLKSMAVLAPVVPYLDVPLQHTHDEVLRRMKRAERSGSVRKILERIRHHMPEAAIRTTMIVGFPGESDAEFDHLESLVGEGWFDHLGVFTYSDEPGTTAYDLPDKVPVEIAEARRDRLMALQQDLSRERLAKMVGKTIPVMVDGLSPESDLLLVGRTPGQAPEVDGVVYINQGEAAAGEIVPVTVSEAFEYDLMGGVAEA
ncbi:MAG: 30S ribosomal protein S12 methylthiotransferase RimO [Magnetococcales bacterium]|nr:30S ribosomal protein S12 methylthiotransferase RimO [Magnetococcales bacterium]